MLRNAYSVLRKYAVQSYATCELHFLDLQEVQLHRRLAAKERHHHAHLGAVHVDLGHRADEVVEWAVDNAHLLAGLEGHLHLGRLGLHPPQDLGHFFRAERGGRVAHAHEAGDAGRVAHHVPRVFTHDHLHQQIAREDAALHRAPLAVLDLDLFFGGHHHVENLALHAHRIDALLEVVAHLVFIAGIAVDDEPVAAVLRRLAELRPRRLRPLAQRLSVG